MIVHPSRFATISKTLKSIGALDKGLIRFADHQMDTEDKRRRVYFSWVVFRHLTFDLNSIADLMNKHSIRLILITGKFDKVIRSENMNRLLAHVQNHKHEILETGHNGLINESADFLSNYSDLAS